MIFANNWHVATRPRLFRYELLAETVKRNGKETVDHVQPHLSHALPRLLYHDEEVALGKPRGKPCCCLVSHGHRNLYISPSERDESGLEGGNYDFEPARAITCMYTILAHCHSLGVHELDYTHSLASLQQSEPSDQQTLLLTETCLQYQQW